MRIVGMMLLVAGMSGAAFGGWLYGAVPEIDSRSAVTGLTLLSGAFLVVKSRLKK